MHEIENKAQKQAFYNFFIEKKRKKYTTDMNTMLLHI